MSKRIRLSKNFHEDEFACKGENCCEHSAPINPHLVIFLQYLRNKVGKPFKITSGFRCRKHNKNEGGKARSFHTRGMAVDVKVPKGISPAALGKLAKDFGFTGIGVYKRERFVHLDTRTWPRTWND